jgi:hypothetical protein
VAYFHIFVIPSPLSPFREVPSGTCERLSCAILPKNQLS